MSKYILWPLAALGAFFVFAYLFLVAYDKDLTRRLGEGKRTVVTI